MKILAVNASYRGERGQTQHMLDLLLDGARQAGAVCESLPLAALKIHHCLGCNHCQQNARLVETRYEVQCIYAEKDDVHMIFEKMKQADLIIYATPVYIFHISALLKTLLERFYGVCYSGALRATKTGLMFHPVDRSLMSKPFVTLIVCDNLEDETPKNTLSYFRTFSKFMEAEQVGVLVRNAGMLSGYGKNPEAAKRFPRLNQVYNAYRQAGRELANIGRILRATQQCANQEIIPVPFFRWIKRIKFVPIKQKFIEKANQMLTNAGG